MAMASMGLDIEEGVSLPVDLFPLAYLVNSEPGNGGHIR